jgi:predicted nucleic acid-binding protein
MVRDLAGYTGFTEDRPTIATVIDTDHRCQQEAWPVFERHYHKGLSFTDCTSLVAIRRRGIDAIASFDDGFDGLVGRVAE